MAGRRVPWFDRILILKLPDEGSTGRETTGPVRFGLAIGRLRDMLVGYMDWKGHCGHPNSKPRVTFDIRVPHKADAG